MWTALYVDGPANGQLHRHSGNVDVRKFADMPELDLRLSADPDEIIDYRPIKHTTYYPVSEILGTVVMYPEPGKGDLALEKVMEGFVRYAGVLRKLEQRPWLKREL